MSLSAQNKFIVIHPFIPSYVIKAINITSYDSAVGGSVELTCWIEKHTPFKKLLLNTPMDPNVIYINFLDEFGSITETLNLRNCRFSVSDMVANWSDPAPTEIKIVYEFDKLD